MTVISGAVLLPLASNAQAETVASPETQSFAGLSVESRFGRWEIAHIAPLDLGGRVLTAMPIGASSTDTASLFELEVLAKDESGGARPPAESARFSVFVRNSGRGATSTVEDHGLAAMALARYLEGVEEGVDASGFMTHAARSQTFHQDLRADLRLSPPRLLR